MQGRRRCYRRITSLSALIALVVLGAGLIHAGTRAIPAQAQVVGLDIVKSDSPDPVQEGQQLTYTIVVTNNSGVSAFNAVLSDPLPGNTTFVSATSTQGTCANSAG